MADEQQAFPVPSAGYSGMTLRDYFAAQSLVAQGTWWPNDEYGRQVHHKSQILKAKAEYAYAMADAMLEARNR